MTLKIHWVNATRSGQDKARVEEVYATQLSNMFDKPEDLIKLKKEFDDAGQPERHVWQSFANIAHLAACSALEPYERRNAYFKVELGA